MKTSFEKADFALRVLTFVAVVAGGSWAIYQYKLSGTDEWTNNISLETKILPYSDKLRLLVIHVKSKNPRNYEFTLKSNLGDTFELRIRKIAIDVKENTVIGENDGNLIRRIDLMQNVEGEYQLLPSAETDDMRTIVLPVNTTVALTAEMNIHNGTKNKQGKPDTDFNSASTVVRVEP
jgi:hypothetical protein